MRREVVCRKGFTLAGLPFAAAALGLCLCAGPVLRPGRAAADDAAPQKEPPFEFHNLHAETLAIDCTTCHQPAKDATGDQKLALTQRPGHANCQDCHDEVKEAKQHTKVCMVCHVGPDMKIEPFPSGRVPVSFSHALHVDPKGRVGPKGVRQDCVFCHHPSTTAPVPQAANHPQCAHCHAGKDAKKPTLDLTKFDLCGGCHSLPAIDAHIRSRLGGEAMAPVGAHGHVEKTSYPWTTTKGEPYRDIVSFPHDRHVQRRDGQPIDCATCHAAILQRTDLSGPLVVPDMKVCASCHENASFVTARALIKNCEVCHEALRADTHPMPTDPVSAKLVHNDYFRRFHRLQAQKDDALCGFCHRDFPNVPVDKCAGCHSSMEPRSHVAARWADQWHGRQVALDRQQCAVCHTSSFCSKCHDQVLPRSHNPLQTWIAGGHRQAARLNLRSCFTCHDFQQTCAECHNEQLPQ
jgi:hypothetical protein